MLHPSSNLPHTDYFAWRCSRQLQTRFGALPDTYVESAQGLTVVCMGTGSAIPRPNRSDLSQEETFRSSPSTSAALFQKEEALIAPVVLMSNHRALSQWSQ